jgi:hypothetical protein
MRLECAVLSTAVEDDRDQPLQLSSIRQVSALHTRLRPCCLA